MMSGIVLCSKRQMNCMEWIYAYYFDIPFEETVRRHNTRDKKQEFGEEDMRRWWREKDFSSVFNEKIITSDIDADSIVEMIYMDSANEG